MLEYQNLSPLEFEYLCQDVMQERLQVPLRRFPAGKDGGIDLVDSLSACGVLVQVKHYLKSPFSALRQALRKELPKVRALNPGQYFICCAQTLSPAQVKEIYQLFSDYMASERNIVTLLEIDDFLCDEKNAALLHKHFKLWLSATHILSELYNQHIFVDAEALLYDVREELPYYVQTESYWKSKAILEAERLLMILGNPGVGKTTVSKMLVLYFASIGYRVRYTTNGDLSDIKRSLSADPELREIVLLDDCLGQCYFRLRDTQESELSALIKYIKFHPSKMLLLNSRVTIFNEAREQAPAFSQLFDRGAISIRRIDAEDIPLREKALILYALMRKFQVPDSYYQSIRSDKKYRQIIQHPNYNPRIIEYAAWRYQDAGAPEAFFSFLMDKIQSPKNVWKDEFERRLDPVDRYFMYTLHSLAVPRPYVSMDAMRQAYQKVLEAIHADISLNHFENVLSRLSRSLVRIVSREQRVVYSREPYHWTFVPDDSQELAVLNPSVSDYLEDVFREPALRRFFKANACYLEQLIHMCDSREEIDAEVKRLSDSGQLDRIRTIQPELTCPLILYSTVRFRITDPQLDSYILPGLLNFPTHYYISSSFMLSHQKRQLILDLWQEPLFSFYHVRDKVNSPEGVKALLCGLELESLVAVANLLHKNLVFSGDWRREDFVSILRDELQDAGQAYLDKWTGDYDASDEETYGNDFRAYCIRLEDEVYDHLDKLEIPEIQYEDFLWDMVEWTEAPDSVQYDAPPVRNGLESEIDMILDRNIE